MEKEFVYNDTTAVVETKRGKVRGYIFDGLTIFKGIPYATAKRFEAPKPVEQWDNVLDCTSYGYVCPLMKLGKPGGELGVPHRYWVMNEDCQNLNVWTPACDDKKRPVLVWFHGGGYAEGSSIEQVAYEGENMSKLGDVVVVSINHRLNILGYFDVSSFGVEYENSGNAGGDDIIASLKWVNTNIEKFGGDPANVTIFGQSGGGAKVTTVLQSPAADGLYSKGINMSGVIGPVLADQKGSGEELAKAIMNEMGISDIKDLQDAPYDTFAAAYLKVKPEFESSGKYIGCSPLANEFYVGTPDVAGFREETKNIPLMVGTTFGEFAAFEPVPFDKDKINEEDGIIKITELLGKDGADEIVPLFKKAYPKRNPVDILNSDFLFRGPAIGYIKDRSALNNCTYSYLFNQDLPMNYHSTPWHCSDIPFVFHNTELVPNTQIPGITEKLEEQIFQSVITFAKTGNPNNKFIPNWPACTSEEEHVMVFGENTGVRTNFDKDYVQTLAKYMGPIFMKRMAEVQVQH